MQRRVANYKRFRELLNEWVDLEVEREQAERAEEKHAGPQLGAYTFSTSPGFTISFTLRLRSG